MIDSTKASKRLGIVGAAAVVGLVPISFLATPAFAVAPGSAALSITPTTPGATSVATNTFTTDSVLPAGGTITINSLASSGAPEALPAEAGVALGAAGQNFSVSYTPSGGTATTATGTVTSTAGTATITVTNAGGIPSGAAVTVSITGVTNPGVPSTVFFNDSESSDTHGAVNTNSVSIGNATVATPTLQSVNPTAYTNAGGEPFTLVGTGFAPGTGATGTGGGAATNNAPPVVCFVASGTAAPTPSGSGAGAVSNCANTTATVGGVANTTTVIPAGSVTFASAGEIQGTSPDFTNGATQVPAKSYNVVVYNWNPAANSGNGGYTASSATSSTSLVGVGANGLNVIPESGVRVIDTRLGQGLPKGVLATNTPLSIPVTQFQNTPQVPTNVPTAVGAGGLAFANVNGLAMNITAVAPASGGNIQVWTAAAACSAANNPGTATVNFQQPQDTNNFQIIPVVPGATNVCVQDNGAAVNLVMDVTGYTDNDQLTGAPADGGYAGTGVGGASVRVLDTRPASQKGSLLGPLAGGTVYRVATGLAAGTYAFNVADVAPTQGGNLRLFPEPAAGIATAAQVPTTAVDTYIPNTDSSAEVILTVPASGNLDMYSDSAGTTNVVIDELGQLTNSSLKTVATPFRIYDSRPGPIAAGSTVNVTASPSGSGSNFVPTGALGVVGNVSDINPDGQGYEVLFPQGGALPGTASIANFPLQTRDTNSVNAINPSNGGFSIYSGGANTNSTFDVTGYIS